MDKHDETIVKVLLRENEDFRREAQAHQRYEKILAEFQRRAHLTADEDVERRKIQKLKLAGKDRMARMIEEYRRSQPGAEGAT